MSEIALHFLKQILRNWLPFGCTSASRRAAALRSFGLKLRMPSRARAAFSRLTMRVHSPVNFFELAVRPLGVLFRECRHHNHFAMTALAAQPAKEHPAQHGGVEPIRLCPLVFPRDRNTAGMDDVHFDPLIGQPACEPEAVATGLRSRRRCARSCGRRASLRRASDAAAAAEPSRSAPSS